MRHALRSSLTIAALELTALTPVALAQQADAPEVPVFRIGGTLGPSIWPALADLDPDLGGDFDRTGFAAEMGVHGGGWRIGPAHLYLGADIGFTGHGSDVEGIVEREDLYASLLFVTPSLKARFASGGRASWTLDAGIGYYDVSVDEWEEDCDWDCDTREYYDDSAIGGYVGIGMEFALGSTEKPLWLVASAKAHLPGLDDPDELEAGGDLDGPIYVLSIGLAFYP
jgi:hypothetical protein